MTDRRHNGGPLMADEAAKLWNHIRAFETIDEQMTELRDDKSARKELVKADGFDTNIVDLILKRRKIGKGETRQADDLVKLYEEALEEQGALPLEETRRKRTAADRRTPEQIARDLHGDASESRH